MVLIGWSLNAIDQIFSTRKQGKGDPACPDGTFAAGYMMDSWKEWRPLCLAILSVEDVEDVYIIGMMITGFLLFGGCVFLLYRKVSEVKAAYLAFEKLPAFAGLQSNFAGLYRMADTQTHALDDQNRKLDTLSQSLCELNCKLDTKYSGNGILQRVSERL
ncbi:unnamed protein product [Boreogadus saida]